MPSRVRTSSIRVCTRRTDLIEVTIPAHFKLVYGKNNFAEHIYFYASLAAWNTLTNTPGSCPNATLDWDVYKRVESIRRGVTAYSKVVSESKQGTWVQVFELGYTDYCDSGTSATIAIPTPEGTAGKPTVHRVMVLPKFNGTVEPAGVGWQWSY